MRTPTSKSLPRRAQRGGLEAMPLEPAFLFSHELLQNALPELLSQTGTTGRQFAQLLIRVWQETRHNNFPDIERAAEECGEPADAADPGCRDGDLQAPRPRHQMVRRRRRANRAARWCVRSFEAPGTVLINKRLRSQEERLKYELAFFIGHKILHNGDGVISPHSAAHIGRWRIGRLGRRHGRAGRALRLARLRVQLFRRRAALPAHSLPALPDPRGASA